MRPKTVRSVYGTPAVIIIPITKAAFYTVLEAISAIVGVSEYFQDIKIICQNHVMKGNSRASEGHPWRNWKIKLVAVDNHRENKGKLNHLLDHVEYILHPTFDNPRRVFVKEPYLLQEKGWGEFDMRVILYFKNHVTEPENIFFDLHFREHTYTIMHRIFFNNPSTDLIQLLNSVSININNNDSSLSPSSYNEYHKKRRTSPLITNNSKKVRTPPSPAQFSDGSLTPSSYNTMKYPTSPSTNMVLNGNEVTTEDLLNRTSRQKRTNQYHQEGIIIDDVYDEKDLENVNPIHNKFVDKNIRLAWGLPQGFDILELARRLSSRTMDQTEEIESIIKSHKKEDMLVEENDDEFVVDLYSLGPDLLNLLWDYTEKRTNPHNPSILSPFSLVQANTNISEDD
ncbi:yeats family-domain-containing protein [Cokeromyces recurvatus]|uniref:yeats family-domain-containing protein n=1 Tax=Cokeromyces recurvatus TaxID=90255 RepID=UPI00221F850E|nr:yeats family-domain-containing protein [Cokeromyces recurvatus]KAI7901160.1 yeats family-domain-containing protein [Cokeromyces recurvatus]